MNTVRLRRTSAIVLALACFALLSAHAQAIPATLPQPDTRTTTSPVSVTWFAQGPSSPAMSPALSPPVKPPEQGPIVVPVKPIDLQPAPEPPDDSPSDPSEPAPPTRTPVPEPPGDPPQDLRPPEASESESHGKPQAPAKDVEPAGRPSTRPSVGTSVELLVKFEAGAAIDSALAQAEIDLATQVVSRIPELGVQIVRLTSKSPEAALEILRRLPGIVYAEPNYPVHILEVPNDPDVQRQWHLDAIEAPAAWDLASGEGATIAIVDTGVDPSELDVKPKIVAGHDFVNGDAEPWDDQGHGTRIALIAAAAANNSYGGVGVAYDARIMPLKALNDTGSGTHAWIAKSIVWAADHGADIINLSVGGPYPSRTLEDAINYAWQRGSLLVAAAGNENSNVPVYPAAYDPVLAVTGTTRDQQRASFSNWGDYVTVAAPGTNILVTRGGRSKRGQGTSLATPQVAGVAALVLSRNPGLSASQVRDIIQSAAQDLGSPGWDPFYGFGQVNAYQAVLQARNGSGGVDPVMAVVNAVNRARQLRDLPALRTDAELMASAQREAENLTSECTAYRGVNLATCVPRSDRIDDRFEVALVGVASADAVVDLLAASPAGQRLLFGPYWQIGAGYVDAGHSSLSQVWVLRFALNRVRPRLGPPGPIQSIN